MTDPAKDFLVHYGKGFKCYFKCIERMTDFKSFGNCSAVAEGEMGQVREACRTTPEQMPSNAPGQDPTSQSVKLG